MARSKDRSFYLASKRMFDITLVLFGILLFLPLLLSISLLILFTQGAPVFYVKKSLGKNGKVYNAIKFRSMGAGSSVTKIGKVLRQTALDELPQLINILKGEMSFVGPRNYGIEKYGLLKDFKKKFAVKEDIDEKLRYFFQRLDVTPGLAGLGQIYAPKYAGHNKVLKWDMEYIKKKNFLLDLRIIFLSIWISLSRGWEKTARKL